MRALLLRGVQVPLGAGNRLVEALYMVEAPIQLCKLAVLAARARQDELEQRLGVLQTLLRVARRQRHLRRLDGKSGRLPHLRSPPFVRNLQCTAGVPHGQSSLVEAGAGVGGMPRAERRVSDRARSAQRLHRPVHVACLLQYLGPSMQGWHVLKARGAVDTSGQRVAFVEQGERRLILPHGRMHGRQMEQCLAVLCRRGSEPPRCHPASGDGGGERGVVTLGGVVRVRAAQQPCHAPSGPHAPRDQSCRDACCAGGDDEADIHFPRASICGNRCAGGAPLPREISTAGLPTIGVLPWISPLVPFTELDARRTG
eukprot:scaffold544_cov117-Isochrysis_galbana.AAC.6